MLTTRQIFDEVITLSLLSVSSQNCVNSFLLVSSIVLFKFNNDPSTRFSKRNSRCFTDVIMEILEKMIHFGQLLRDKLTKIVRFP